MKPLIVTASAISLLALGGLLGRLITTKPDLAPQLAASEARAANLDRQVKALRQSQASLNGEIAELRARLSAAGTAAPVRSAVSKTPIPGSPESPSTPSLSSPPTGAKPFEEFSKMMKNPAMREMAKQQQLAMQDMIYSDLYSALHLNDEDKAYFRQLLAARTGFQADAGMRLMDSSLTPEARQAIVDEMKQQNDQGDANIRTFLDNDADYQLYQHYQQTASERIFLTMNQGAFDADPLTPEQQTQLIDTMHNAAISSGNSPGNYAAPFDPSKFTQAAMDEQLQRLDRQAQAINTAAAAFLSAQQLQILNQIQASQRNMTATGFQMFKSMGGGAK
jgi:hypothetical protein